MKQLSKSEIKALNDTLNTQYGIEPLSKKDKVTTDDKYLRVNDDIAFFYLENRLVPTLRYVSGKDFLKKIVVDMGAIKFLCSGADLMRPGIRSIEDGIAAGDIVLIVDEKNSKPIMIGEALLDAQGIREQVSGKSVKNLHYVGDDLWNTK